MKKKIFFFLGLVIIVLISATWYYVFVYAKNHHRNVAAESAIVLSAVDLVKAYQNNEIAANAQYLNKAMEITGVVLDTKKDQAGNTTITLQSADPFSSVFCTLTTSGQIPANGNIVKVKGVCNGYLSDVVINEAVLLK